MLEMIKEIKLKINEESKLTFLECRLEYEKTFLLTFLRTKSQKIKDTLEEVKTALENTKYFKELTICEVTESIKATLISEQRESKDITFFIIIKELHNLVLIKEKIKYESDSLIIENSYSINQNKPVYSEGNQTTNQQLEKTKIISISWNCFEYVFLDFSKESNFSAVETKEKTKIISILTILLERIKNFNDDSGEIIFVNKDTKETFNEKRTIVINSLNDAIKKVENEKPFADEIKNSCSQKRHKLFMRKSVINNN